MTTSPNIKPGRYMESDFTKPTPICPKPVHWHTHDIQATEIEVIEMVHGMIRGLQPEMVLETGTSRGFMAKSIGNALYVNGHGRLITFEPDEDTWREACRTVGANPYITMANQASMVPWNARKIDFAWHDSLIELRQPEFEFYLPHYSDRAVVCFHDTAPHFGDWSDYLRTQLKTEGFSYLDWPSPRGVIIARRNP